MSWQRSSYCDNVNCVEVSRTGDDVLVRDSKDPDPDRALVFTRAEWADFLQGVQAGEFE